MLHLFRQNPSPYTSVIVQPYDCFSQSEIHVCLRYVCAKLTGSFYISNVHRQPFFIIDIPAY